MKIEGTHELKAPRDRVYAAMVDPAVLARTIPGCEKLENAGDNTYAVTLRAGVGSIKGLFTGSVRLEEMRPPASPEFAKGSNSRGAPFR